jgi:hypothetical protein
MEWFGMKLMKRTIVNLDWANGLVAAINGDGTLTIDIGNVSLYNVRYLAGFAPELGERVALMPVGRSDVIVTGKAVSELPDDAVMTQMGLQ